MKISILILAHKNPEQLRKLIDRLKTDFEIFVHFDIRSTIALQFEEEAHVHILKNRYMTSWGSRNIVLAEIELLRAAYTSGCDYYILISGQDLPVISNKGIKDFIEQNNNDYIDHHKLPVSFWGLSGGMGRLHYYWETKKDDLLSTAIIKPLFWLFRKIQKILRIKRNVKFDVYGGCNWFNLTKASVEYILHFIDNNNAFLQRFKYTRASDELFFQTVLMGFDHKRKNEIRSEHLRYFDWETGPQYPRILTIDDYSHCISSNALFARKFDDKTDAIVIDKILAHTQ
jgi:hypothetical protein